MGPVPDPYRVLGLARGATLDEVKRAYRRLAKEHHPDSGGERALPRFLEIQAAYEQLVGPATGRGRAARPAPGARPSPWQAEDSRAEATRRAYGTRARRPSSRTAPPPPDEPPRERPPRRGRSPNKATPGSTTYDGAEDEPFEPGWTGASWYGTTSGTYWTLNPREYADPRKHGPEYQARARRRAGADPTEPFENVDEPAPGASTDSRNGHDHPSSDATDDPVAPTGTAGSSDPAGSSGATGAASWSTTGGPSATVRPRPGRSPGERRGPDRDPSLSDLGAWLLDDRRAGIGRRIGLAIAGGLPLAIGLAWLLGELTGCGRFSAACDPGVVSFAWVAGLGLIATLVLVPAVASIATIGTVALFAAGIPAAILLSATGGARLPEASSAVLGVVLVAGWLAGVTYGVGRRRRGRPTDHGPRGPVS